MRLILPAVLLLFTSQAAHADWQFTRWGMSPEQVLKASDGKAPLAPPQSSQAGTTFNVGDYTWGEDRFTTNFNYVDRRLSSVALEKAGPCRSLKDDLLTAHGKPVEEFSVTSLAEIKKWVDVNKGNNVMLMEFRDSCTLVYTESTAKSRSGL